MRSATSAYSSTSLSPRRPALHLVIRRLQRPSYGVRRPPPPYLAHQLRRERNRRAPPAANNPPNATAIKATGSGTGVYVTPITRLATFDASGNSTNAKVPR